MRMKFQHLELFFEEICPYSVHKNTFIFTNVEIYPFFNGRPFRFDVIILKLNWLLVGIFFYLSHIRGYVRTSAKEDAHQFLTSWIIRLRSYNCFLVVVPSIGRILQNLVCVLRMSCYLCVSSFIKLGHCI